MEKTDLTNEIIKLQVPIGKALEDADFILWESANETQQKIRNVVFLSEGLSKNKNLYSAELIKQFVDLIQTQQIEEGKKLKVFQNHNSQPRSIQDLIAFADNLHIISSSKGLKAIGDLIFRDSNNAREAFELCQNFYEEIGLSIDARGIVSRVEYNDEIVNEIIEIIQVHSTDLVIEPAANRNLLESFDETEEDTIENLQIALHKSEEEIFRLRRELEHYHQKELYEQKRLRLLKVAERLKVPIRILSDKIIELFISSEEEEWENKNECEYLAKRFANNIKKYN